MSILSFCLLLLPLFTHLTDAIPNPNSNSLLLKPISDKSSLWRREDDFSCFDLQEQEHFLYGAAKNASIVFANMTMSAAEGEKILSMERFGSLIESVTCGYGDMVLKFKSKDSFQYAMKQWKWANEKKENKFIMVANHDGCGPAGQRQPYYVTGSRKNEKELTATLDAEQTTWKTVAQFFDLDFGTIPPGAVPNGYIASRDITWDPSVTLDLHSDFSADIFSTNINGVNLDLKCSKCGTDGKLALAGHVSVSFGGVTALSLSAKPQNVQAFLEVAVTASGALTPPFDWTKKLGSIPIAGFEVADIITVGGTLDFNLGFHMSSWTAQATVSTGVIATLPNSATLTIDFKNPDNSQFSGWIPTFSGIPVGVSGSVSADFQAYAEPALNIGISVLGVGYEAGLDLKLPEIDATLAALASTFGVCDSTKVTGVQFESTIGVDLSVVAVFTADRAHPIFQKTLFKNSVPFVNLCLPVGPDEPPTPTTLPIIPPTDGVSPEACKKYMDAPPAGRTLFYSGYVLDLAREYAKNNSYVLLEQLMRYSPPESFQGRQRVVFWLNCSQALAELTTGNTQCLINTDFPPGEAWKDYEFPVLKTNTKVPTVFKVNSKTLKIKTLWPCSDPNASDLDCPANVENKRGLLEARDFD